MFLSVAADNFSASPHDPLNAEARHEAGKMISLRT